MVFVKVMQLIFQINSDEPITPQLAATGVELSLVSAPAQCSEVLADRKDFAVYLWQ